MNSKLSRPDYGEKQFIVRDMSKFTKCVHVFFRLNGKCLIDEDYLRSIGVENFEKYRSDPDHEPPRMMPQEFPSLLVKEEGESAISVSKL